MRHNDLTYGLRLQGEQSSVVLNEPVELALRRCGLWAALAECLHQPIARLNGERRYLLALARTLMLAPQVLLRDTAGVSLGSSAAHHLETLPHELQYDHAILIATRDMSWAARLLRSCLFLQAGVLAEPNRTDRMFTCPDRPDTEHYLAGRRGPMYTNDLKKWRK